MTTPSEQEARARKATDDANGDVVRRAASRWWREYGFSVPPGKRAAATTGFYVGYNLGRAAILASREVEADARPSDRERLTGSEETSATVLGRLYDHALTMARAAAYKHGYALAVHGSEVRDLDVIAVPWTAEASDADTLAEAIREMTGGTFGQHPREERPNGRLVWTIHLNNEHTIGNFKSILPYIDLSVTPKPVEADARLAELEAESAKWRHLLERIVFEKRALESGTLHGPRSKTDKHFWTAIDYAGLQLGR